MCLVKAEVFFQKSELLIICSCVTLNNKHFIVIVFRTMQLVGSVLNRTEMTEEQNQTDLTWFDLIQLKTVSFETEIMTIFQKFIPQIPNTRRTNLPPNPPNYVSNLISNLYKDSNEEFKKYNRMYTEELIKLNVKIQQKLPKAEDPPQIQSKLPIIRLMRFSLIKGEVYSLM